MVQTHKDRDPAIQVKAMIFALFLIACFSLYKLTPIGDFLEPQALRDLAAAHNTSPLVFVLLYALGITLFLPASLFTAVGALMFGLSWGLIYNFAGAMLGATMSFWIGRYLGRDFAASVTGDRLKKYDTKIAENGFKTTLYLRLIFFPFTPLNFGMGLTSVTFRQFFWGTFFGKIASGIILTFFFAALAEVWISGQWTNLLNWQSLVAVFFIYGFNLYSKNREKIHFYSEYLPKIVRLTIENGKMG
jgi:uncharacterized membrane protein YdjX (TVP38/TMEM64 family)